MTSSDKKLLLFGAGPAIVCGVGMLIALVSGLAPNDWVRALAMAALLSAIVFPAFGNVLRMRRDRRRKVR